jgi:dihydroorotate dehydrogenase electron transfer subunit
MKELVNRPHIVSITKIETETPLIKTYYFSLKEISEQADPGQFVMVWMPQIDEIPLSLSETQPMLAVTVKQVGEATKALHTLKAGDRLGIRGPYGHSFLLNGTSPLIVGGGIGMAPFLFLIRKLQKTAKRITVINGARTKNELVFLNQLQKLSSAGIDCIFTTDDGTYGEKGLASDMATRKLLEGSFDQVYACGPELMIWELFTTTEKLKIPLQASLERLIKCGIGLCGQCCLDPIGYRICVEGPVFSSETLRKITDLGKYRRDFGGSKIKI